MNQREPLRYEVTIVSTVALRCPHGSECAVEVTVANGVPSAIAACTGGHIIGTSEALDIAREAVRTVEASMRGES